MDTFRLQAHRSGSPLGVPSPEYDEMLEAAELQGQRSKGNENDIDEDDTEPDEGALPKGAGPRGRGQPLQVGLFEKHRDLIDGAGLCSLGKWCPSKRQ